MKLLIATLSLMLAVATASAAAPKSYTLIPNSGEVANCRKIGFVGAFTFKEENNRIWRATFSQTKASFVVLPAGANRYIMSVQGSYSILIQLDFNAKTLSYSSSAPGRAGYCYGTIR